MQIYSFSINYTSFQDFFFHFRPKKRNYSIKIGDKKRNYSVEIGGKKRNYSVKIGIKKRNYSEICRKSVITITAITLFLLINIKHYNDEGKA